MVTGFDPAREADRVVCFDEDTFGIRLDYSPASLAQVDFILQTLGDNWDGVEQFEEAIRGFGCYVGEVLVRWGGGRWIRSANVRSTSPYVVVCGAARFDPIEMVRGCYLGNAASLQRQLGSFLRSATPSARVRGGAAAGRRGVEDAVPVC